MNKVDYWFLTGLVLCVLAGVVFALYTRDTGVLAFKDLALEEAGAAGAEPTSSRTATFEMKDEPIRPIPLNQPEHVRNVAIGHQQPDVPLGQTRHQVHRQGQRRLRIPR